MELCFLLIFKLYKTDMKKMIDEAYKNDLVGSHLCCKFFTNFQNSECQITLYDAKHKEFSKDWKMYNTGQFFEYCLTLSFLILNRYEKNFLRKIDTNGKNKGASNAHKKI